MKKILITGHKGFIGSCFLKSLSDEYEIFTSDYKGGDYDPDNLPDLSHIDIVVHMGAVSSTNATNKEEIFHKNIMSTLNIIEKAKNAKIIYASSASTYGSMTKHKISEHAQLKPQSLYAKSKAVLDSLVLNYFPHRKIIGLRFFNVCSFHFEGHKTQPSPTYYFHKQLSETGEIFLFEGSENIFRDFIYIKDVVDIMNYFVDNDVTSSLVVNVGTGKPISFEQIADRMISKFGFGKKVYIKKPFDLSNSYQTYTEADMSYLRNLGYEADIPDILHYIGEL
jgi:ADP-L-glycero-D-manno-heptose 6-epimerase